MDAVVDSSAFIACLLPDEVPPRSLLEVLRAARLVQPSHWPCEIANALWTALRRNRINAAELSTIRTEVLRRTVELEPAALSTSIMAAFDLARQHGLTVYDATYLELAIRRGLPLATLDADLRKAAKKARVKLL